LALLQVMLINVVAMDMLKSKIPPGKRAGLFLEYATNCLKIFQAQFDPRMWGGGW
jgi:hypothetical protein